MTHDVLIVGAGPVGLFCAWRLGAAGLSVGLVERRCGDRAQTRALGIHRPSLMAMPPAARERLLAAGVRICRAQVRLHGNPLTTFDFRHAGEPHPYVLSVPQPRLEAVLWDAVRAVGVQCYRGWLAHKLETADSPRLLLRDPGGAEHRATPRWLIGCDGVHSWLRQQLGIPFRGSVYPDHYWMGDFRDPAPAPAPPDEAMIFLGRSGLVEALPMPGGLRRWVLRRPGHSSGRPQPESFRRDVAARTGLSLGEAAGDLTEFRAESYVSAAFRHGSCLLLGDAAHVISPIGGQGMNLGWANTVDLTDTLVRLRQSPAADPVVALQAWELAARRRLARCRHRAEFNMRFGQAGPWAPVLARLMALATRTPWLRRRLASQFSMSDVYTRGLDSIPGPGLS